MLILDTPKQERQRYFKVVENTRQLTAQGLAHQRREVQRNAPVDGFDPTREEHQMGKPLNWRTLVSSIQKLNPDVMFEDSPSAPDKTIALLYPLQVTNETGGTELKKQFLCAFEKEMLPEYTVLRPVYEWAWDETARDFVKVLKTTRFLRGWREVLVMLLNAGLVTQADVDLLFPVSRIRRSWHELTRNRPVKKQRTGPLIELAR